jgi:hypothetical protein
MFQEGRTVESFGSIYQVEKIYEVTDGEMQKYNLYHRRRVTLRKIKGENGTDVMDFAYPLSYEEVTCR